MMLQRRIWRLCAWFVGFGLMLPSHGAAAVPEYELKLALAWKIARFVDWPDEDSNRAFRFCIAGRDPFDDATEQLDGLEIEGRLVSIARIQMHDAGTSDCNVILAVDCRSSCISRLVDELIGRPVLTIGDAQGFAVSGGIVELEQRENRLAFIVNRQASQEAGLIFGSQLLQLATLVQTQTGASQ